MGTAILSTGQGVLADMAILLSLNGRPLRDCAVNPPWPPPLPPRLYHGNNRRDDAENYNDDARHQKVLRYFSFQSVYLLSKNRMSDFTSTRKVLILLSNRSFMVLCSVMLSVTSVSIRCIYASNVSFLTYSGGSGTLSLTKNGLSASCFSLWCLSSASPLSLFHVILYHDICSPLT